MESEERAVVIGFVGSSGAGKTTLLERVVARLESEGLRVGVVKHASHGFEADRPGKDSHRLYGAGAYAVALVSREEMALFRRTGSDGSDHEPELELALAALPRGLDVVLVEGFAWAPIPRFVVVRGKDAPRHEHLQRGPVIRIVRTRDPEGGQPFSLPESTVEAVAEHVLRGCRRRRTQARVAAETRCTPESMTAVIPERPVEVDLGARGA